MTGEQTISTLLGMKIRPHPDICPTCGSDPTGRDHDHKVGCTRIDTCGQFGPPWIIEEDWHPLTGELEADGEPGWMAAMNMHRHTIEHRFVEDQGKLSPSRP